MIRTYLEHVYSDDILSDLDPETRFYSESGSRFKPTYYPVVDGDGGFELKEKGYVDIYSAIQSHKDSVDINLIVKRFEDGDIDALNKAKGFFADVTMFPKTMAEALQIKANCEAAFAYLPVEVREKFDFDVNKFVASYGTEDFYSVFEGKSSPDSVDVVKESVVDVQESE